MAKNLKYPQLHDTAWLTEQYITLGKSTIQIGEELNCNPGYVQVQLGKAGIKLRGRWSNRWTPKTCVVCGTEFTPTGPATKFCSVKCRIKPKTCDQCGKSFIPRAPRNYQAKGGTWREYRNRFCSRECLVTWRGENCAHRWVNGEGYVEIMVEPTMHKDVDSNGYVRINVGTGKLSPGRVKEHRWVMEQRLGRTLLPNEEIHHKNAIRTDNDRCPHCPTRTLPPVIVTRSGKERLLCETCGWQGGHSPNLELWDGSQPKGGRVTDKMTWAIEFLSQYGRVKFTPSVSLPTKPAGEVATLF